MVLLRGRQEDALDCKLSHVPLESFSLEKWKPKLKKLFQLSKNDKAHSYEALSYIWGSPSTSEYLLCDGKNINITPNHRDALRRLRLADRHRALWVDQICINQSDTDERSSQVALMDGIYKMAKQVVAWLGPDPDRICNDAHKILVSIAQGKIGSLNGPYLPDNALLKAHGLPEIGHAAWKALNSLISLPYFTRAWILQEVILARSIVFVWGELQVPYKYLISLGDWLNNNTPLYSGPTPLLGPGGVDCVTTLRVDPEGLFEELILHSILRARTDPRDLVYSILGLIKSGPHIEPNYKKTKLEVFRDATLQAIVDRRGLDILFTVHHATDEDLKPREWPTWVPRWTERPPVLVGTRHRTFCSSKLDSFHEPVLLANSQTLQIEGRRLASIIYVVSLGPVDSEQRLQYQGSGHFIKQIWTAWCAVNENPTAKERYPELIKAFIFTLLCGKPYMWDPKCQPWELCYEGFAAWWTHRLVEYLMSEDFPQDPVDYISERISLAMLARIAAQRVLQVSMSTKLEDVMALRVLNSHLTEKYGDSTAEKVIVLVRDLFSEKKFEEFSSTWAVTGLMRDFFLLSDGHIGVGPWIIREDDIVAILSGGKVPYSPRPIENSRDMFLGECYIHGIMFGEACREHNKKIYHVYL